jgi:hypothetical protein
MPLFMITVCALQYHVYSIFFQKEDEEEQQDEQLDEEELEETDEFDLEIKVSNPEKVGKINYVSYCVLIGRLTAAMHFFPPPVFAILLPTSQNFYVHCSKIDVHLAKFDIQPLKRS